MSDINNCQYCGRSYDYWDSNKAGTDYAGRFCSPKCNYEALRTGSFKPSSSSSSRSSGGAGGCALIFGIIGSVFVLSLLMGVIQFLGFVFNHPDSNMDVKKRSQSSNQGYKASCGDNDPNGSSLSWYPVFVNKADQNTLNYIRQNYCGDAFIKYRESANRESIQVASFLDYSKADDFAKSMIRDSQINSGEVGEATQN
jgi:hypothetical protein